MAGKNLNFVESEKKGLIIFAYGLFFSIFLPFFMLIAVTFFTKQLDVTSDYNLIIAQFIGSLMVAILLVLIMGKKRVLNITKKIFSSKTLLYGIVIVTAIIGFNLIYNLILTNIFNVDITTNSNQTSVESLVKNTPILSFILVVFLAPISEEIMYRYGLFGGLLKRNRYLAYGVSVIGFTIIHFVSSIGSEVGFLKELLTFFPYALSGLLLAYSYEKTKSFAVPLFAHSLNNIISYVSIMLPVIFSI